MTGGRHSGWTTRKRAAGLLVAEPGPEEAYFSRRFADLLHVDDPWRLNVLASVAARSPADTTDTIGAQMQAYQVDGRNEQVGTPAALLARLAAAPPILDELGELGELGELADLLASRSALVQHPVPGLEDTPL